MAPYVNIDQTCLFKTKAHLIEIVFVDVLM